MNKKTLIVIIALVVVIAAVLFFVLKDKKTVSANLSPAEIYTKISEKITLPSFVEPSVSDLELFYDVTLEEGDLHVYKVAEVSPSVETVAIFKLKDETKAQELKEKLEAVKQSQAATMKDYSPENYSIANSGVVKLKGAYVYLVMSKNVNSITAIIDENI